MEGHDAPPVSDEVPALLLAVLDPVEEVEHQQYAGDHDHPERQQPQGPEEGDAPDEAHEQRRIAERRQQAADVRDEEDEEDRDVGRVPALGVGLEQGPDEQHAGPGRADEVGQDRPDEQE